MISAMAWYRANLVFWLVMVPVHFFLWFRSHGRMPTWVLGVPVLCAFSAWFNLRRGQKDLQRRRVEQGFCRTCGYDLRASEGGWPECGTPIPPNVEAAA